MTNTLKIFGSFLGASMLAASFSSQAGLIGQWTFDDLTDSTGNWNDLTLRDGATLDNGRLDISASGLQWANTTGFGSSITDKTLVSWVEMTNPNATTGSAMTIDSASVDQFDGLIWSENFAQQWQVGSSFGVHNINLGSDSQHPAEGGVVQIAATFEDQGNGTVHIRYFINGVLVGDYLDSPVFTWGANDAEIIFGARHTVGTTSPIASGGGLDAFIYEAQLFDTALTQAEIQSLDLAENLTNNVPSPGSLLLLAVALPWLRRQMV